MFGVRKTALPDNTFLAQYKLNKHAHTDCYSVVLNQQVLLEDYVRAFYTGRLFRMERWLISIIVKHKSSDQQLEDMLAANSDTFSAWTVEDRSEHQLIMSDYQKRTRSWFMAVPENGATHLYFGSAVVKTDYLEQKTERVAPLIFKILMPFHYLYSRLLLGGAVRTLRKAR